MRPTYSAASTLVENLRPMLNMKYVKWAQKDFSHTNNRAVSERAIGQSQSLQQGNLPRRCPVVPTPHAGVARVGRQPLALGLFDTTGQDNYGKLPPPNQSTDTHLIWLSGSPLKQTKQSPCLWGLSISFFRGCFLLSLLRGKGSGLTETLGGLLWGPCFSL